MCIKIDFGFYTILFPHNDVKILCSKCQILKISSWLFYFVLGETWWWKTFYCINAEICWTWDFGFSGVLIIPPSLVSVSLSTEAVPSKGLFSFTVGSFAADVSLQKATVDGGGDLLTWTWSHQTQNNTDLSVSALSHSDGSHSYQLRFPLSHPKIIPEVRVTEQFYHVYKFKNNLLSNPSL